MSGLKLGHEIGEYLTRQFRQELAVQGHKMSGKLINSIEYKIREEGGSLFVDFYFEKYGIYLEHGVRPSNIPYTSKRGSRGSGKRSKYIEGLIRFAKKRMGASRKRAERIAFAIASNQSKEGMPTKGSKKFSKTGRRVGWISYTLEKSDAHLDTLFSDWIEMQLDILIDSFLSSKS